MRFSAQWKTWQASFPQVTPPNKNHKENISFDWKCCRGRFMINLVFYKCYTIFFKLYLFYSQKPLYRQHRGKHWGSVWQNRKSRAHWARQSVHCDSAFPVFSHQSRQSLFWLAVGNWRNHHVSVTAPHKTQLASWSVLVQPTLRRHWRGKKLLSFFLLFFRIHRRIYLHLFKWIQSAAGLKALKPAQCQWALLNVQIITLLFPFTVQK